jgi:O-antigen/teichoic acid export membrane protein
MNTPGARVFKNASILTALKVVVPMLSLAVVLGISRWLGTQGLGRYTLIVTYHTFFTTIGPFGLDAILMREGARDSDSFPDLVGHAILLGAALSCALMPIMVALGWLLHYDAATRVAMALMSLAILPTTLQVYFDAVFVSRQRADYIAIGAFVDVFVRVSGGLLALTLGFDVVAIVVTFIAGQSCSAILSFLLMRRAGVRPRWRLQRHLAVSLLSAGPTFVAIAVFATIYWRIDVLMLSLMGSLNEVGLYGASYRMMEIAKVLPQSICLALYPAVSHAAAYEPERLRRLGADTMRFLWVITLPIAIGVTTLARPILVFTVGDAFVPATNVLYVLIWTIVPYAVTRYYAFVLVAANKQRVDLLLNIVMALANVLLNLLLIPRYGSLGAAIATLISVAMFAAGQCLYLRRYLPDHLAALPPLLRPMLASVAMGACAWLCRELPVLLVVAGAALIYFSILIASRYFAVDELRMFGLHRIPGLSAVLK